MTTPQSISARIMLLGIRLYQATLSPFIGMHCRFHPTCSRYAAEAITRFGALRGGALAIRRLASCHPLGRSGYDPVPDSTEPTS